MSILKIILLIHLVYSSLAFASESTKERLVLMPLRLSDEDKNLKTAMEIALSEGLQQTYTVFSGDKVQLKTKEIFNNESKAAIKECDETKCMQDIAIAFQSELIAIANVTKRDNGYFLSLSIQNIFDNKIVYSRSIAFEKTNSFTVIEKLKELSIIKIEKAKILPTQEKKVQSVLWSQDDIWKDAQEQNTIESYSSYIDSFPNGKYLPLAKLKIKKLILNTNVWIDRSTHLMWQDDQEIKSNYKDWYEAMVYCKNVGLNDYADWRLPSMEELKSLTYKREYLKYLAPLSHWSSTTTNDKESSAYLIKIGNKNWQSMLKEVQAPVRCVRDYKE